MHFYKGQGATEYLVLLAVVLIVALVSVALLGERRGILQLADFMASLAIGTSKPKPVQLAQLL